MSAKILVVGPKQSGKSCISNALAGVTMAPPEARGADSDSEEAEGKGGEPAEQGLRDLPYRPTAAVRVVELEVKLSGAQARNWKGERTVEVELWDCSGDTKYESCWPALQKQVDGVVIVYNPENATHSSQVETWFDWFVSKGGLSQDQCLVLANDRQSGPDDPQGKPPPALDDAQLIFTDAKQVPHMKSSFKDFVASIGAYKA